MAERNSGVGEMTSLAERKRLAGQRLVIGIPKAHVDDDSARLIRDLRPAGFVLFARNVEEPSQVRELNRELRSVVDPSVPAIRCVDQEGGRVARVRDPATVWPPMMTLGRCPELLPQVAKAMATELLAMEFDLDFAPVCDVNSNPKNPVIGDRAFGDRPDGVARAVSAFIEGMQSTGMIACAKHFPGHGDTAQDSHHDLPKVEREEADLRQIELPPFKAAVNARVGSFMSCHVIYPAWDEDWPGTLSPKVTQRLLREELGYDGVVFTDDLEMKAIHGRWAVEQQVRRIDEAGIDIFLVCHTASLQLQYFEQMVREMEADKGFEESCKASAKRVQAMRVRFFTERAPIGLDAIGKAEHKDLAELVRRRGEG